MFGTVFIEVCWSILCSFFMHESCKSPSLSSSSLYKSNVPRDVLAAHILRFVSRRNNWPLGPSGGATSGFTAETQECSHSTNKDSLRSPNPPRVHWCVLCCRLDPAPTATFTWAKSAKRRFSPSHAGEKGLLKVVKLFTAPRSHRDPSCNAG